MNITDRVKLVADPLIAAGATPEQVRAEVYTQTRVGIGGGGSGPDQSIPLCGYCGANGGGGHGGLCPNADRPPWSPMRWLVFLGPDDDDPCAIWPGAHRHLIREDGTVGVVVERIEGSIYHPRDGDMLRNAELTGSAVPVVFDGVSFRPER